MPRLASAPGFEPLAPTLVSAIMKERGFSSEWQPSGEHVAGPGQAAAKGDTPVRAVSR